MGLYDRLLVGHSVQPVGVGAGARDQADGSISRQSGDVSRHWLGQTWLEHPH
jgi:hypothetical protein